MTVCLKCQCFITACIYSFYTFRIRASTASVLGGLGRTRLSSWKAGVVFQGPLWDHAGRGRVIIAAGPNSELCGARGVTRDGVHELLKINLPTGGLTLKNATKSAHFITFLGPDLLIDLDRELVNI